MVVVPQTMQNDPWHWEKGETSVKSCEAEHCDHPERTGRQVGDKCEIMRAENTECSGRQLWETDKWEKSAKSCGPKHSENPECLLQENKPGDKRQIRRPESRACTPFKGVRTPHR